MWHELGRTAVRTGFWWGSLREEATFRRRWRDNVKFHCKEM